MRRPEARYGRRYKCVRYAWVTVASNIARRLAISYINRKWTDIFGKKCAADARELMPAMRSPFGIRAGRRRETGRGRLRRDERTRTEDRKLIQVMLLFEKKRESVHHNNQSLWDRVQKSYSLGQLNAKRSHTEKITYVIIYARRHRVCTISDCLCCRKDQNWPARFSHISIPDNSSRTIHNIHTLQLKHSVVAI